MTRSCDVTIVGAGHSALVASAYLARAGLRTVVLERLPHVGGAAVSTPSFHQFPARLSRYSYLVSLLPSRIVADLNLRLELRSRTTASYSPVAGTGGPTGLLVERHPGAATEESFRTLTGGSGEYAEWQRLHRDLQTVAAEVAPTLTEPLITEHEAAQRVGPRIFDWLVRTPIGHEIERRLSHDTVRGVVATDALIGTFASLYDESRVQNRCLLYHVIGDGIGEWRVPVGGMGAVTDAIASAARSAGAEIITEAIVTGIETDGKRTHTTYEWDGETHTVESPFVLSGVAPSVLDVLRGRGKPGEGEPEGSQLKLNLLVERLPRFRSGIDPTVAFNGTLHVDEGFSQLESAYRTAKAGRLPHPTPGEFYCHSLTDPTILDPGLAERGFHTLTYFGVHTPARLFDEQNAETGPTAAEDALDALDSHLAEPIRECLATDPEGRPCLEVKTPRDIETELNMPGGHIFHGPLQWPWLDAEAAHPETPAERWGVASPDANVLLCGSGARRGGGVSGVGGHNAAHAVLETLGRRPQRPTTRAS